MARVGIAAPVLYGVYVHIPWCRIRCPYCAFDISTRTDPPHAAYADALIREWALRRERFEGAPATVFFGGGTPSLCPPREIGRVLEALAPAPGAEISLELNPTGIGPGALRELRAVGITRLSIGVQSFDADTARRLGRRRDALAAPAVLAAARRVGFSSISLDLMFGVPGQTRARLREDLDAALDADHVSLYGLTIEEGTPFARGRIASADDDLWREMYDDAVDALAAAGIDRYEVSNFARAGHACVHNEHYWRARPWAGLGASAHAWWPDGTRAVNVAGAEAYLAAGDPLVSAERPAPRLLAAELIGSTLRHVGGLDRRLLRAHTGLEIKPEASLVTMGLISVDADRVRLARDGFPVADGVARRLAHTLRPPDASSGPSAPGGSDKYLTPPEAGRP